LSVCLICPVFRFLLFCFSFFQALVQWEEGWCSLEESDPLWDTVAATIKRGRDGREQVRWRPSWEKEEDVHWVPDAAAHDLDAGDARAGGGHGDAGGANVQQGGGDGGTGVEARASGGGLLDRSTRGSRKIKTSLVAFLSSSSRRRTVPPGTASSRPSPAVAAAALSKELGSPPRQTHLPAPALLPQGVHRGLQRSARAWSLLPHFLLQ
jgi:hypothetical protein